MSIIPKQEIIRLAKEPSIKLLGDNYLIDNIKGASYDLRIGTIYYKNRILSITNYRKKILSLKKFDKTIIKLLPSEIITMLTLEEVHLPDYICGTVFPINSKSSSGLLILNPGHIDPGFKGPISVCAINLSEETKYLTIGEDIFTIIFDELISKTEPYTKNFEGDRGEYEIKFYKERSSKLSPSFFDLLKVEKYEKHLRKLILHEIGKIFLIAVPIIALIIASLNFFFQLNKKTSKPETNSRPQTEIVYPVDTVKKLIERN
jgi:deoxycytidine triphosphate deaminase